MRVKKLISFYKILHFFQHSSRTQSSKSLIERMFFGFLCLLYKDSEKLVHFGSFVSGSAFIPCIIQKKQ